MKTKAFIAISLFFLNIEKATANCEQQQQSAQTSCDRGQITEILAKIKALELAAQSSNQTVPTAQRSRTDFGVEQAKMSTIEKKCYEAFQHCIKVCNAEATSSDPSVASTAQQGSDYCQKEPKETYEAAKQGNMDIGQIIQGLGAVLSALGAGGGDDVGDPCATNPARCAVDTAAKGSDTSRSGSTRQSTGDGGALEAALGNDDPATGEGAEPNIAQGTPGMGGGGGINSAGMAGAPARGRGVAEQEDDGKPKINLASSGFGGGSKGGAPSMGASSLGKGSGNPIASRTGIDADGKSISSQAMENAMQARGLASGSGPMGGITAAHSLDNFQKIEKCIQNERNLLSER